MQLYYGGYMQGKTFVGGFPVRHPWDIERIIERYAALGKPIYVTEVSVPSSHPAADSGLDIGWWHGPWDPERQAAWIKLFYTLCYSIPQVKEITWWNASDEASFIKDGGLLHADATPKPAARMLASLTAGWLARGEVPVAEDGTAVLRGAAGEYRLWLEHEGRRLGPVVLQVQPGRRAPLTVEFAG